VNKGYTISICILFGLILLAGCGKDFNNPLDPENSSYEPPYIKYTKQGWAEYKNKNFDSAIEYFRKATDNNKNYADAHVGLGWSYFMKHSILSSIIEFQQALAIDPKQADAHVGLAGAYLTKDEYESAIEHAQEALNTEPEYTFSQNPAISKQNVQMVLAVSYYYLGDYENALEQLKSLKEVELDEESESFPTDLLREIESVREHLAF